MVVLRIDFLGVFPQEMSEIIVDAKKILKNEGFNEYDEQNVVNVVLPGMKNVPNANECAKMIKQYTFKNTEKNYSVAMSQESLSLQYTPGDYISFEKYASIFLSIAKIYNEKIDFFTVKRFGLRKVNTCCITDVSLLNKYFSEEYFKFKNCFDDSTMNLSQRMQAFTINDIDVHLVYKIAKGTLKGKDALEVSMDADFFSTEPNKIKNILAKESEVININDRLFEIFSCSLTDEFKKTLTDEDGELPDVLVGVHSNE